MNNEPMCYAINTIEHGLNALKPFCNIQYPNNISRSIRCAYDKLYATSKATDLDEVADCISDTKFELAIAIQETSQHLMDNRELEYYNVSAYANLMKELSIVLADLEMMNFL